MLRPIANRSIAQVPADMKGHDAEKSSPFRDEGGHIVEDGKPVTETPICANTEAERAARIKGARSQGKDTQLGALLPRCFLPYHLLGALNLAN